MHQIVICFCVFVDQLVPSVACTLKRDLISWTDDLITWEKYNYLNTSKSNGKLLWPTTKGDSIKRLEPGSPTS